MKMKITCDACRRDDLLGQPHIALNFHPKHMTGAREMHFCGTSCMGRYLVNIQAHENEGLEFRKKNPRGIT